MTCETCGAVDVVAWAMAESFCGPCWLATFEEDSEPVGGQSC